MTAASRVRGAAVLAAGAALLAACTGGGDAGSSSAAPTPTPTSASESPAPSPTTSPTPAPTPPPLAPGTSRGRLLVVQQAEDAALVSGGQPIRLTMARTGNVASWFTAPPQKLAGTMSTELAMSTLGWRPADDGTTAVMPNPRPNGLLSFIGGSLAFTVQRANVRADGTLVLDIRPIGAAPETVESYGPVSLTLDGAPGVLGLESTLGEITVRVIVTGERSEQAVVQAVDAEGEVLESAFVSPEETTIDSWLDVTSGTTTWSDPVVAFTPPERSAPGTVRVSGALTIDGATTDLDRVIARWSLPLTR
ncbi:MAG: hypothetical protein RLZ94_802 [Actinomycetota bacterium]